MTKSGRAVRGFSRSRRESSVRQRRFDQERAWAPPMVTWDLVAISSPVVRGTLPMSVAIRPDPNRDPIGPFLHYLMSECGVSPNTLAAYRSDMMRFNRWRKQHAPGVLAQLDIADLSGYVDHLVQAGLAPSSVG